MQLLWTSRIVFMTLDYDSIKDPPWGNRVQPYCCRTLWGRDLSYVRFLWSRQANTSCVATLYARFTSFISPCNRYGGFGHSDLHRAPLLGVPFSWDEMICKTTRIAFTSRDPIPHHCVKSEVGISKCVNLQTAFPLQSNIYGLSPSMRSPIAFGKQ